MFYIAEGVKGRSREAQVPALCELFDQPYLFSDPLTMRACLDKAVAKRLVRDAGVPTPTFAVAEAARRTSRTGRLPGLRQAAGRRHRQGLRGGLSGQHRAGLHEAAATRVIERYRQPALVEHYLPGREFTVGIVGNGDEARVLGVCEILLREDAEANVYSLHNKELCEDLVIYAPASDSEALLAGARALQPIRRSNAATWRASTSAPTPDGEPCFLEANSLAGLNPWHSDLPILAAQNGIEFTVLIGMILDAGLARYGLSAQRYGAPAENGLMAGRQGFIPVVHAATESRPDEIDTLVAANAVAGALGSLGYAAEIVALAPNLGQLDALPARRPLTVFNLVDAVNGDGRLAPFVPARLDALSLPYTGCSASAWLDTLSKISTKLKLAHAGLPTPAWSEDGGEFDPDARVIVKPIWEHGSLGLDDASVLRGGDAARAIEERNLCWKTEHFAESYLDGREFNLSLLEGPSGPSRAAHRRNRVRGLLGPSRPRSSATTPNGRPTATPISARRAASVLKPRTPRSPPSSKTSRLPAGTCSRCRAMRASISASMAKASRQFSKLT